jgi:hypothetical protein
MRKNTVVDKRETGTILFIFEQQQTSAVYSSSATFDMMVNSLSSSRALT